MCVNVLVCLYFQSINRVWSWSMTMYDHSWTRLTMVTEGQWMVIWPCPSGTMSVMVHGTVWPWSLMDMVDHDGWPRCQLTEGSQPWLTRVSDHYFSPGTDFVHHYSWRNIRCRCQLKIEIIWSKNQSFFRQCSWHNAFNLINLYAIYIIYGDYYQKLKICTT